MLSGIRLSLAAAGVLFLLLVVLATLQYRWIGEVSEAERDRMRASARRAADRVAADFNLEITRALDEFGLPPGSSDPYAGIGPHIAAAAKRWAASSRFPSLVREVFVVERDADGTLRLDRVNLSSGNLEPSDWPSGFEPARRAIEERVSPAFDGAAPPDRAGSQGRLEGPRERDRDVPRENHPDRGPAFSHGRFGPQLLAEIPAILIPDMRRRNPPGGFAGERRWTILRLDQQAALTGFLPELVRRYFGGTGEYDVAVVRSADPLAVLYRSRPGFPSGPLRGTDAEVFFFGGRSGPDGPNQGGPPSMRLEDGPRAPLREPRAGASPGGFGRGAWRLVALHRTGSLQAAVAASRRRNLAVSAAILLLLAAVVATLLVSADRTRRLARQQVEFVAGLTHELRTPLAAIRSAGQNLADGVVTDRDRVRQYGILLEREGRRLSELIEQALAHAGIQARGNGARIGPVAIAEILENALAACRSLAQEQGTALETAVARDLPPVLGDPSALRTLFENLVSNAIKYGGRAGSVRVQARAEGRSVEVTVRDTGPGISPRDLPHIFEPFYRGSDASSGRVAGSGLGLSLVRRVVEAYGGGVRVESEPGKGTAFHVTLPAAPSPTPGLSPEPEVAS
jgi:signal transduction histidine kinase